MPDLRTPIETIPVPTGMQYSPADYTSLQAVIDNEINALIDAIGGPNFLPSQNPVTIVPTSGMTVQCGGSGQFVIAQGRVLDSCPATNITLAASGGSDRVDLIAIQATRVNGASTITRNVRAINATPQVVVLSGTLSAGAATVNLPTGYTSPPEVFGIAPLGADSIGKVDVTSVSTTQATFSSTDSTDTRGFSFGVYGTPTGYAGVPTTITLQENRPAWQYVQGSSMTPPSPPSGYDSFATILVHASETSISSSDITYLFPTIPILSEENFEVDQITIGESGIENNNAIFIGNNSSEGGSGKLTRLSVNSSSLVAGIHGSLLTIDDYLVSYKLALDTNGNLGIPGALYTGTAGTAQQVAMEIANASTNSGSQQLTRIGVGTNDISGISNTLLGFADEGHSFLACFDLSGNIGIAGGLYTGSSLYGPNSATIVGNITAQSFTASTITGLLLAHGASVQSDINGALYLNPAGGQNVNIANNLDVGSVTVSGSATITSTLGVGGNTTLNNLDVGGTLQVVGAATFNTAPTMSGANIANGTVPTAALVSIPIGGVVRVQARLSGSSGQSLALGSALPPGNWTLFADALTDIPSGTVTLTGSGSGVTWESASTSADGSGMEPVQLMGTATGGQTPVVAITYSVGNITPTQYQGCLTLTCYRTS